MWPLVMSDCVFAGDFIIGLQEVDANWWQGMIEERVGIFPVNYVWQLDARHLKVKHLLSQSIQAQKQ